jgi:hypothetical protein
MDSITNFQHSWINDLAKVNQTVPVLLDLFDINHHSQNWNREEEVCKTIEGEPFSLNILNQLIITAIYHGGPTNLIMRALRSLTELVGRISNRLYLTFELQKETEVGDNRINSILSDLQDIHLKLYMGIREQKPEYAELLQKNPRMLIELSRLLVFISLLSYTRKRLSFEHMVQIVERGIVSSNRKIFKKNFSGPFYSKISKGSPLRYSDKALLRTRRVTYMKIRFLFDLLAKGYVIEAFDEQSGQ